jgi:valyl-tRNA synthetase
MSKSLGNGIDPLEIIDKYGADALRFMLITGNAPGNDMRFIWDRLDASRNFANKIWNASRFIMMNMDSAKEAGITDEAINAVTLSDLTMADKWIVAKANQLVRDVTDNMEKFELGIAADKIHDFLWDEFCDWYIEMVKPRLWDKEDGTKAAALWTLREVLSIGLKLLHPYMPFVTEEIYCTLTGDESIMISDWPVAEEERDFDTEAKNVDIIKDAVRAIRTVRTDMNVPPSKKASVIVVSDKENIRNVFEESSSFFGALAYANDIKTQSDKTGIADDAVSVVIHNAVIYIPFAELVDIAKEIERLEKEKTRLEGELKRVNGMLANPNFVNKAPEAKLNEEKEKLAKYTSMYEQVNERLAALK